MNPLHPIRMTRSPESPDLSPRDGWTPIEDLPSAPFGRSYVSGEPDGPRVRIAYYHCAATDRVKAPVWFGPRCVGPPGHAHGGALAAVLDEIMGLVSWYRGIPSLLARLTTENRQKLPLERVWLAEAWLERHEGRKLTIRGHIVDDEGRPFVESEGLFIDIGEAGFARLFADMSSDHPADGEALRRFVERSRALHAERTLASCSSAETNPRASQSSQAQPHDRA